jgi:hypothetical protein
LKNSILRLKLEILFFPVDFVIEFDQHGHPMRATKNPNKEAVTKVAVVLHNPKDFTSNVRRLKGQHRLAERHLEILGYKVINIDPHVWNTMYMSEKLAKYDYLENSIFNKSRVHNCL